MLQSMGWIREIVPSADQQEAFTHGGVGKWLYGGGTNSLKGQQWFLLAKAGT